MPVAKRPEKYETPSWDYIHELCINLADQIRQRKYEPDIIVAISRGGWIPGRLLSDLMGKLDIATIKVEHYVDFYKTLKKPEITQPLPIEVIGKKILLVDDLADSGSSLRLVTDYLRKQGAKDVKICALYWKPWSTVVPDFCARETDAWICFPHETYETIGKLYAKFKKQGKSSKEIEKKLTLIGIRPLHIKKFLSQVAGEKKS
ncbi:MAG: phosphoribosyltransferase [Methanobacteriota archaeon]